MALRLPSDTGVVKFMAIAAVVLYILMQFINFSAIGTTDGQIFKAPTDEVVPGVFKWLVIAMGVILTYSIVGLGESGMTRKKFITLAIVGVALYFLYTKVLTGLGLGLPDLNAAAYNLQMMVGG